MLELSDPKRTYFYLRKSILNYGWRGFLNYATAFWELHREPAHLRASPIAIQIELMRTCDFRCGYCIHHLLDVRKGAMPLEVFERVLQNFPFAIKLTLQGIGEPLLHPEFGDLVRAAKKRKLWVQTFTNGSRLLERAEEVVNSGIDRVNVSLDTTDAALLSQVRPGANAEKILAGIAKLINLTRSRDSKLEIHVYAVLLPATAPTLIDTIETIANLGVKHFHLQGCHSFGSKHLRSRAGELSIWPSANDVKRVAQQCRIACQNGGMTFRGSAEKLGTKRHCQWPWYKAYVSFDGEVRFCCRNIQVDGSLSPGNVLQDGWLKVWNNSSYREFRQALRSPEIPKHCDGCAAYSLEY